MKSRNREINVGLCGGLSPELIKDMVERGMVNTGTSLSGLAIARCVLCHLKRREVVTAPKLTACTGVTQNTYNTLARLEEGEQLAFAGLAPAAKPWQPDANTFVAGTPEVAQLAQKTPIPEDCVEVSEAA